MSCSGMKLDGLFNKGTTKNDITYSIKNIVTYVERRERSSERSERLQ